jgi:DNA polymerase I
MQRMNDSEQASPAIAPSLMLVDGSSYLYRAFHAMPDMRATPGDPSSQPTGAIRGIVNMMRALRDQHSFTHAACVFDASGPTFRDDIYPQYKATRSPMPDDLRAQIDPIHEVVRLLGWPVLVVPQVEADDVIGTLAKRAAEQGMKVTVSSGDKDLSQLVNDQITIVDTMNNKVRDVAGVTAEFGVPPSQMIDFQALVGDTVDNVPGVDKVGPKTAAKLLTEYGSLDAIMQRANEVKGVVGENLRKALEWLPTGKRLVTIKTDCDLAGHINGFPALDNISFGAESTEPLTEFFTRYGFKGLVASEKKKAVAQSVAQGQTMALFSDEPAAASSATTQVEIITTREQLQTWLAKVQEAELTALDTETTSLDEMVAEVVGISLCVDLGTACYIPLAHVDASDPLVPQQLPRDEVIATLKPWLEDARAKKLGQHIKYDQHVLQNHGVMLRGIAHDTMLQSYVLEVHKPHSLESLALRHAGRKGLSYEDLCGKGAHQISFTQVAIDRAAQYSAEDVDFTLDVHQRLWPQLAADAKLRFVYELEIASSNTLQRIERNGVLIDAENLEGQSHELGRRILELEQQAHAIAGQPFNLSSPKQIGEIFFQKLGLPVVKKTATGAPSTDEEVLEKLAEDYPLPAKILEHRSLAKLKGTYTDKLGLMRNARTGRVHTHYAQAVAVTGRLSSNDPNLQNIPIRTPEGRRVREAFVAPAGSVIASADYSQIELRIMAHLSEDEALLAAFGAGEDVHRATAAEVFGVPVADVTGEQRRYAKVINFGLIYGMGPYGLAKALSVDANAAKAFIEKYFTRFSGVKRYMDSTRQMAKDLGFVQTVFGRRLVLPEINSPNGPRRSGAERAAINAPMQGTAADLIKLSMNAVQTAINAERLQTKMIMQVHDELVFEVPQAEVGWLKTEVPRIMAGVAQLKVPLLAEVGVGKNWEEAH